MSVTIEQGDRVFTLLGLVFMALIVFQLILLRSSMEKLTKLVKSTPVIKEPRVPGSAIGKLVIHSEDDEHLGHFKEYLP